MLVSARRYGDVTRLELASAASRLVGYTASVYVVETPATAGVGARVLVDTGPPLAWRTLRHTLDALGDDGIGRTIRGALVTHQHEDHAGNAAALARAGVPLAMSAATRAALHTIAPIGFYRRVTWGAMQPLPTASATFDPAPFVLVPTPGHTRDHHVIWQPDTETLFGGDLFLGVQVRIAHPTEDPRALAHSLRTAAALRPRRLFDAHRGLVEAPAAALDAKAAWLDDMVGRVDRLLDAGWPVHRIRATLLNGESAVGYLSGGEYSRAGFVRAVAATRVPSAVATMLHGGRES